MLQKSLKFLPIIIFTSVMLLFVTKSHSKEGVRVTHSNIEINLDRYKSIYTGEHIKLDKEKVLVRVFSSWCGHCIRDHKDFSEFTEKHKIKTLGLFIQDSEQNIKNMLFRLGNPFFDVAMIAEKDIFNLGIVSVPQTMIVYDGKIIARFSGGSIKSKEYQNEILELLK